MDLEITDHEATAWRETYLSRSKAEPNALSAGDSSDILHVVLQSIEPRPYFFSSLSGIRENTGEKLAIDIAARSYQPDAGSAQ
jgi:hypothetical protein